MNDARWQHPDWTLLWVWVCYCAINFVTIMMVTLGLLPAGVVWDIFYFWRCYAPAIVCLVVFGLQIGCEKRPFTWTGLVIFTILISTVGYLNLNLFAKVASPV